MIRSFRGPVVPAAHPRVVGVGWAGLQGRSGGPVGRSKLPAHVRRAVAKRRLAAAQPTVPAHSAQAGRGVLTGRRGDVDAPTVCLEARCEPATGLQAATRSVATPRSRPPDGHEASAGGGAADGP